MGTFCREFNNFTAPKGLYRVWVRADDRVGAPLVARWTDPRVEGKISPTHEGLCIEEQAEVEAPEFDPDLALVCAAGAF